MRKQGITLVYCIEEKISPLIETYVKSVGGYLVDNKLTYRKEIKKKNIQQINYPNGYTVEQYKEGIPTAKMNNLAIESGIHSRFNNDPKINSNVFKKLYKTWMYNSVNKTIANEVFIAKNNNNIVGMMTLNKIKNEGRIGLIAVDFLNRGQGIGSSLIHQGELWCISEGLESFQVITQQKNKEACYLYSKNKFILRKSETVYHIWLNN